MAPSASQGMVDPTKAAKYPVILSDELLGKDVKEVYTAIKYNHKPSLSSDTAPARASLKASAAHPGSFNLSFNDNGDKYAYNGVRDTDKNQFVLVFDPARKAFVLHRVDSAFHMNLIRTPSSSDVDGLKAEHPHIETPVRAETQARGGKHPESNQTKSSGKEAKARKPTTKDKVPPPVPLTLPKVDAPRPDPKAAASATGKPAGSSSRRRQLSPAESEDEDDDDDGGLLIEYPGGEEPPSSKHIPADFSPAFPPQEGRRFSEFVRTNSGGEFGVAEGEDDADAEFEDVLQGAQEGEEEEEEEENQLAAFKLPSPVNHPSSAAYGREAAAMPVVEEGEPDADDIEADLEAELENALQEATRDMDSESSVSEED